GGLCGQRTSRIALSPQVLTIFSVLESPPLRGVSGLTSLFLLTTPSVKPLEIFKPLEAGAGKSLVPIGPYKEVNDGDQLGVARERGIARGDPNQQVDDPCYGGQRKNDKQEHEREDTIG